MRCRKHQEILEGSQRHDLNLRTLNDDLKRMLQQWFSIGFLKLQRIDWDSPARILEKVKEYSVAVHPINSWNELKERLGYGKRCFAFFHPSMPEGEVLLHLLFLDHFQLFFLL